MKYLRMLSMLLAVLTLLTLVACKPDVPPIDPGTDPDTPIDPDPEGGEPSDPDTPTVPTTGDFMLSDTTAYTVVVSEYGSKQETAAARAVRNALEQAFGAKPKLSSDWLTGAPTDEEVASWLEILIGDVDRPERKSATEEMGGDSFVIRVTGNKLIILGATDEMTLSAAEYFAACILKNEQGSYIDFVKSDFIYRDNNDPVLIETVYEQDDVVVANIVATEYPYYADPTGQTDSTAAIQQALDDLHEQGGGTVYLPVGQYLVTGTVTVPAGCLLKGDWQDPDAVGAGQAQYGTVILAKPRALDEKHLADRTRDPLISLTQNCAVDGLTVYYPEQDASNVTKYGYTLYSQAPSCVTISNVTLLNSYRGIGIDVHADDTHELVQIEHVRMTALEIGLEMYHSTEVGNSVDIRVTPDYWAQAGAGYACKSADALKAYCRENTVGLQFNGLDDTHLSELYIDGARTAIYMPLGYTSHDFWGVIYDVTVKNCDYGIVVESLNGYGGAAVAKAVIDASQAAVYNSAKTGALKLCDVNAIGKGGIVSTGNARTYEEYTDVSAYSLVHATYQKPQAKLYVAPILNMSKTKKDIAPALQSTLDAAAATGGIVYVPAGVYSIYRTVTVPAGVELRGSAPFFMRDSSSGSDGIDGTVLLTYVQDSATVELNEGAGVNGLRIFGGVYSPEDARDLLAADDAVTRDHSAIKGLGANVYAHNVVLTATFNGIDFTGCDNHSVKQAFGAVYGDFILAGGRGGVIEQCLTNQHFVNRQHFGAAGLLDTKYYSGWVADSLMTCVLRDEVRRVWGDMVHLIDAEGEQVSNIFTYAPRCLVLCDNSSATLLNTSSDFHGMGPMFDVKNGSDVVAVNALRSANESIACDESSDFLMINRIAISRFNEPNFDSSVSRVDEVEYTNVRDKVMINDGTKTVTGATPYTGDMSKTDGTALYHAASPSTSATAMLYSQTFSPIAVDHYMNDNGYLHMWVYVEDMTSSIWSGWISLASSGGTQIWSNICYITHNGWNEVWLPMTGASGRVSGNITGLTITDQRSAKMEHSTFYFDDIYLCIADSDNPEVMRNQKAMDIAPGTPNMVKQMADARPDMLLTCDSLYGNRARTTPVRVVTDPERVKEGTGSWQLTSSPTLSQVAIVMETRTAANYMKHGYLHLWVYVEDASAVSGGAVELTSSGTHDANEISWHLKNHIKKSGWNELLLPMNAPDSTTGSFAPAGLNYIRVYFNTYRKTTILIDDVRLYLPPDAPAADAPDADLPDEQSYVFKVGDEQEGAHLAGNSAFNTNTRVRFADNDRSFTYSYYVGDFSRVTAMKFAATLSGQLVLDISTDEINWTTVYRYESGDMADRGLAAQRRTYNLADFLTEKGAKSGYVFVRISDAYTENGYGGAIAATTPVEATVYYVPTDPSAWESEEPEGGLPTVEMPDVLPATETHIFYAGEMSEEGYLAENNLSSLLYGKRFADEYRSFTYAYPVYDSSKVTALVWTAKTSQELRIQISQDGSRWKDVYLYDGEPRGLAAEERTYDLLSLIDKSSKSMMVYIKIGDAYPDDGYGGAVSADEPVTFKVTYAGGTGDVVIEGNAADDGATGALPDVETPRPEGEVDQKLVVHACETTDGAVMRWVPVTVNEDPDFVKEGKASWKRAGESNEYVALNFGPMDISAYMENGYLHLWFYVSKYNLAANGQIELCSGGSADKNELRWSTADYIKGAGWNELFLPLADATLNNESQPFDPAGANYIRLWCGTTDGRYYTMFIDDIYFCTMK